MPRAIALGWMLCLVACAEATPPPETPEPPSVPAAPPGDPLLAGFAAADQWAANGHPRSGENAQLFDEYCASRRRGSSCDRPFYKTATSEPARFAKELAARRDPVLTSAVFVELLNEHGPDATTALLRELDDDPETWETGIFAAARKLLQSRLAFAYPSATRKLAEEARRHARAKAQPRARGAALYVFAVLRGERETCSSECLDAVDWAHFAEWFGELLGAEDFDAFLDVAPESWSLSHLVAPALSRGWSRAKVVESRLAAMDPSGDYEIIASRTRAASQLLCAEGDGADLRELATFFKRPSADHPPRTALVSSLESDAARCAPAPARHARQ